jgi:hypothetical protein
MLAEQIEVLNRINKLIGDSSNLQIRTAVDAANKVTGGLFDNSGRMVAGLSTETARQIAALGAQNQIITNQTTGQTAALNAAQKLTTGEVDKVGKLQGQTISVTELVERATNSNASFTRALLDRLSAGIPLTDINVLVSGNDQIVSRLTTISNLLGEQASERKRIEEINKLQSSLAASVQQKDASVAGVSEAISSIRSLERATGARIENSRGGAATLAQREDGTAQFDGAWVMGSSKAHAAFREQFWNPGGLQDQMFQSSRAVAQANRAIEAQRNAIRALGGVPKFATGGAHMGGARIVGERGPELEVTGPSQIHSSASTMQMLSNAPVVSELKNLRREFAAMRDEQRQLGIQTARNTERGYRVLREWNVTGLPEERVE